MGGPGPLGGDGGGPDQILAMLAKLQQGPPPDAEQEAMRDATMKISMALSRIQMRSAKAARLLSEAISKIHSAREALGQEADRAVGPPPAMGMPPAMAGAPGGGGGGMF